MSHPPPSDDFSRPDFDYPIGQWRFWSEEKLRNADTDLQGHVNNAVQATLYEAGRIETLRQPALRDILSGCSIVVVRLLINYKLELFYPGWVRIGSRVPRIGRSSLDFEQAIFARNGEVSTAQATCVLLDRVSRKPVPVPEAARQFLGG